MSLEEFAFQACSFNHSDISPFRINDLRAVWNSVSQNPPSNPSVPGCGLYSAVCGRASIDRRGNCVRPPNVVRSLTAILQRFDHRRQCRGPLRRGWGIERCRQRCRVVFVAHRSFRDRKKGGCYDLALIGPKRRRTIARSDDVQPDGTRRARSPVSFDRRDGQTHGTRCSLADE